MEIVPIIYTVLIVVVVLTILTLIFSFYSLRKKQGRVDEILPKKSVPSQNNSYLNKNESLKPISILSTKMAIQIKERKKIKSSSKIESEIKKTKNDKLSKDNKKKLIHNSRIEVLNTIQNKKTTNDKTEQRQNLTSLGSNLLENYSDEEKNDMFTLKVKNQKDKPKNS